MKNLLKPLPVKQRQTVLARMVMLSEPLTGSEIFSSGGLFWTGKKEERIA